MSIGRESSPIHWNYFLALEQDLERLSRFVDFSGNDDAYSLEIARLLLGACAETDVVLKQLTASITPGQEVSSLGEYCAPVTGEFPNFTAFEVVLPRFGVSLTPWSGWQQHAAPLWWSDHNKVKHSRHEHFERATLKNCLNAMGGLYIAVLHLHAEEARNGELLGHPSIFNVGDSHFGGNQTGRFGNSYVYKI